MKKILVIGAHFDDAELGAGGTIAKLVQKGKKVYKLTLTDNVTNFAQKSIQVDYDSSKNQSAKASQILSATEITDFIPIGCSMLSYSKDIMQKVEKVIYDYNIDTVFIHFSTDMNQDHVEASKICKTAARHCDNILEYQSNGYVLENAFYPTFFVDISDTVELKRRALQQYSNEHNRYNRLFEMNIERNHTWGYANEIEYAEGFHVVKMLERF
jgi:LmbE family N-acetylglucosaminyl deacetylase